MPCVGDTPFPAAASSQLATKLGGNAPVTEIDMSQTEDIAGLLKSQAPADLQGLAYCVGDIVLKPLRRASAADFRNCFDLHVVGAAESIKGVEAQLKKNSGSVVLFSSVAVQQVQPAVQDLLSILPVLTCCLACFRASQTTPSSHLQKELWRALRVHLLLSSPQRLG